MAAVAVGLCQPCALFNGRSPRLCASGNAKLGWVSLAWNPLLLRSGSRFPTVNSGRDGKRRIAPWRASAGEEIGEERVGENIEVVKGFGGKLREKLKDSISSAVKPAVAVFLAGVLLLHPVDDAMAASSGGRMGGRAFRAPPPPSRSYSGGGGGGRVYSAPPIYGSPYGFGSPFGFSPFSPFFGGGYGGGLLLGPSVGFGGGGGFLLFSVIAFVTFRAIAGFFRDRSGDRDDFDD